MRKDLLSRHRSVSSKMLQTWKQRLRLPSPMSVRFLWRTEIEWKVLKKMV